jgi:hypothetical protein
LTFRRIKVIFQAFGFNVQGILAKVYLANPHSPFEGLFTLFTLPFTLFKGESPFSKGEWISQKKIHPSKRVNAFTLEGESPSKRVNHPFEG